MTINEELNSLHALLERGALTPEEFAQAKARLLGDQETPDVPRQAPSEQSPPPQAGPVDVPPVSTQHRRRGRKGTTIAVVSGVALGCVAFVAVAAGASEESPACTTLASARGETEQLSTILGTSPLGDTVAQAQAVLDSLEASEGQAEALAPAEAARLRSANTEFQEFLLSRPPGMTLLHIDGWASWLEAAPSAASSYVADVDSIQTAIGCSVVTSSPASAAEGAAESGTGVDSGAISPEYGQIATEILGVGSQVQAAASTQSTSGLIEAGEKLQTLASRGRALGAANNTAFDRHWEQAMADFATAARALQDLEAADITSAWESGVKALTTATSYL